VPSGLTFVLRRLGYALLTILTALTLAFIALRALPGDAIDAQLLTSGASAGEIAERRARLGLDQPLVSQYLHMLGQLARGDLGESLYSGRPVSDILGEQFGATAALAAGALCFGLILGLNLGIIAALGRWLWLRLGANAIITLLLSAPLYWTATLVIYLVSVQWRLLPFGGSSNEPRFLILPWTVLGASLAGPVASLTAASLLDYREADFIRTARAKGLRERVVVRRHMLRAGLGAIIRLVALQIGFLLGGAVITETIFVRQGIGQLVLTAMNERDYPVVQAAVVLSATIYSLLSALADITAAWLDPRLRATP